MSSRDISCLVVGQSSRYGCKRHDPVFTRHQTSLLSYRRAFKAPRSHHKKPRRDTDMLPSRRYPDTPTHTLSSVSSCALRLPNDSCEFETAKDVRVHCIHTRFVFSQQSLTASVVFNRYARPLQAVQPCDGRPAPRTECAVVSAHHTFEEWDGDALGRLLLGRCNSPRHN